MAQLTAAIKSILNGSKVPAPTTGEMKATLGTLYDFVTELLGTDSSDKAAARAALGITNVGSGHRNLLRNPLFQINQRGYPSGGATLPDPPSVDAYTFDSWQVDQSTQSVTYSSLDPGNARTLTVPSGGLYQTVHAEDVRGTTYALNWQGTALGFVDDVQVQKNAPITVSPGTGLKVSFKSGTLSFPQFEPDICGPFIARPYVAELQIAEWLFERGRAYTAGGKIWVPFRQQKRRAPFMSYSILSGSGSVTMGASTIYGFEMTSTGEVMVEWSAQSGIL